MGAMPEHRDRDRAHGRSCKGGPVGAGYVGSSACGPGSRTRKQLPPPGRDT